MRTAGQFLQDSPFTDGQIFIGPGQFGLAVGNPAIALGNSGANYAPAYYNLNGAGTTYNLVATLSHLLRTGTAPNYQEQFGTAALVSGPSSVSNTSDPLNIVGMPPTKKANLATLTGGPNGYISKGIQVNWIDVIYSPGANNLTSASLGITAISFANNVAFANTVLANYSAGLPITAQTNPYVTRVTPTTIKFIVSNDSEIQILVGLQTGATATCAFYGIVVGVSFNFN